jgi:hypothetical protein
MRRVISAALSMCMFATFPMVVGCDREVKREETTVQKSDGTTVHEESVKKVTPNGDVVTEKSKSVQNP